MKTPIPVLLVFLPLLAVLAACAPPVGQEEQGNLTVFLPGGGRAIAGDILESLEYRLTFLHHSSGERRNAVIPRGRESVTLNLILGDWTVHADAYLKDGQVFGSGDADFRILADRTNSVIIDMNSVFLTRVEAVNEEISSAEDGVGDTADNPIPLKVSLDLTADWDLLLEAIDLGEKFVALDLSASTMGPENTVFDPLMSAGAGGDRVVSLVLPNTVTSIRRGDGNPTFPDFSVLERVEGRAVASVGEWAFKGSSIKSISLPVATDIGDSAFKDCNNLESVDLPKAVTIGGDAFNGCTSLGRGLTDPVSFPAAVTIGGDAFRGCTGLRSVSFPAAKSISGYAFKGCIGLESVSLPVATGIGDFAFWKCTLLSSVSFPAATEIRDSAFQDCTSLESVSLSVATEIGNAAFKGCTSLQSVSLLVATEIGDYAFESCTSLGLGLTDPVSLPAALTIGQGAFKGCTGLQSVSLLVATEIGDYAFESCTSLGLGLTDPVSFPAAVTIGEYAFIGCTGLQSVSFPAATEIRKWAFRECRALETVSLPSAVKIDGMAFEFTETTELTVTLGAAAPALGIEMFGGVTGTKPVNVKVPAGAVGYGSSPTNDTDENWGNGFRGGGWNEDGGYRNDVVNGYITLTITEIQAP